MGDAKKDKKGKQLASSDPTTPSGSGVASPSDLRGRGQEKDEKPSKKGSLSSVEPRSPALSGERLEGQRKLSTSLPNLDQENSDLLKNSDKSSAKKGFFSSLFSSGKTVKPDKDKIGGGPSPRRESSKGDSPFPPLCEASDDTGADVTAFQEMLLRSDCSLPLLIGYSLPVGEPNDGQVWALLRVFDSQNTVISLIRSILETELVITPLSTLFRSSTFPAQVISAYCRRIASEYVSSRLKVFMESTKRITQSLEDASAAAQNSAVLAELCTRLSDTLLASLDAVPIPLRQVCHVMWTGISPRSPRDAASIVAGLFFLRLICPPLTLPPADLNLTPIQRRNLILVSKIVQQIANGELYSTEGNMAAMNPYIEGRIPIFRQFLESLSSSVPDCPPSPLLGALSSREREQVQRDGVVKLFSYCVKNEHRFSEVVTAFPVLIRSPQKWPDMEPQLHAALKTA
jgi:hypothetical protein